MSSTQQPLFVIYDRQYGNYIRLYELVPDRFIRADRYTLFDLQQQGMQYTGDWQQQQRSTIQQRAPVRQEQQRDLPKFVSDLILRDAAAEGKLCPITMEPIEATEAYTVTPCYHAFNKEALARWTREHTTCPECNHCLLILSR
jgi:patatin-like phospholipase/acyl hydrolase